jgi:hypothetical protein
LPEICEQEGRRFRAHFVGPVVVVPDGDDASELWRAGSFGTFPGQRESIAHRRCRRRGFGFDSRRRPTAQLGGTEYDMGTIK